MLKLQIQNPLGPNPPYLNFDCATISDIENHDCFSVEKQNNTIHFLWTGVPEEFEVISKEKPWPSNPTANSKRRIGWGRKA